MIIQNKKRALFPRSAGSLMHLTICPGAESPNLLFSLHEKAIIRDGQAHHVPRAHATPNLNAFVDVVHKKEIDVERMFRRCA